MRPAPEPNEPSPPAPDDDLMLPYSSADEVPVVGWPVVLRHRLGHRVHSSDHYRWWVLATVLAGVFASGFTITILAVSIGELATSLHSSSTALTWVVTGPLLAVALTMPLFGKLGDVWGHRRVYLLGLAGFTVGAALTALAWSGPSLIAIRTIGAIPGAAMGPASMALIMRAFPEEDRVKAMGWWSLVGAGAPVIGLVAGGPLVDAFGWRAIFVAQAPISLAALVLAFVVLHETPRREREPVDVLGAATLALATVSALLGLTLGGRIGWSNPVVIGLFAVSPFALWWFVRTERRAPHPLLPLAFFRERNFTASLSAQFATNFAYMGGFIVTPLLVQRRFDFTVAQTSLAMVCRPLSFSIFAPIAGYIGARVGERRAAMAGVSALVASMGLFVVASVGDVLPLVFVALVLSGIGMGACSPSLVAAVANAVSGRDQGVANAAQQMVASIGTVAGIQVLSTVLGDSSSGGAFAAAYLVGGVLAVAGLVAAGAVVPPPRRAELRVSDAA